MCFFCVTYRHSQSSFLWIKVPEVVNDKIFQEIRSTLKRAPSSDCFSPSITRCNLRSKNHKSKFYKDVKYYETSVTIHVHLIFLENEKTTPINLMISFVDANQGVPLYFSFPSLKVLLRPFLFWIAAMVTVWPLVVNEKYVQLLTSSWCLNKLRICILVDLIIESSKFYFLLEKKKSSAST